MRKTELKNTAEKTIASLNSHLSYLSDHSKETEIKKTANSGFIIEVLLIVFAIYNDIFNWSIGLAIISISCYHILRLILLIKKKKRLDEEIPVVKVKINIKDLESVIGIIGRHVFLIAFSIIYSIIC